MFSSITSKFNASLNGNGQQHTSQYTPTPPQNYNNAPPQVPAPWMVEWSSDRNCWLYINRETGQSSWVNPSQLQPQSHHGYQANTFSPPAQQQSQPNYQNTGFPPPPYSQYNPAAFSPPSQQQSQGCYQPSYQSPPPQQAPQPYPQTFFQPPPLPQQQQQQQSGFQGRPAQKYQQQGIPQNVAPAKTSHTGRNVALGLGALVAGVVGVEMFTDNDSNGDSGGGFFSSGNDSSSVNNGGTSDYTTSGFGGDASTSDYTTPSYGGDAGTIDYSTPSYGGDASTGDGGYSQADGQALLDAQDMVDASVAQGSADMASAIW